MWTRPKSDYAQEYTYEKNKLNHLYLKFPNTCVCSEIVVMNTVLILCCKDAWMSHKSYFYIQLYKSDSYSGGFANAILSYSF